MKQIPALLLRFLSPSSFGHEMKMLFDLNFMRTSISRLLLDKDADLEKRKKEKVDEGAEYINADGRFFNR